MVFSGVELRASVLLVIKPTQKQRERGRERKEIHSISSRNTEASGLTAAQVVENQDLSVNLWTPFWHPEAILQTRKRTGTRARVEGSWVIKGLAE